MEPKGRKSVYGNDTRDPLKGKSPMNSGHLYVPYYSSNTLIILKKVATNVPPKEVVYGTVLAPM